MLLDETKKIIEALLFMKGEEGLNIEYFSTFMEVEPYEAENMLNVFCEEYNKFNNSLIIKKFGATYKMLLREEMAEIIKKAVISKNLVKLRGVSSDSILHSLVSKELIVSNKTLDTIGKPKLYETTDLFLDVFGLESLEQLPKSEIVSIEQINKFLQN